MVPGTHGSHGTLHGRKGVRLMRAPLHLLAYSWRLLQLFRCGFTAVDVGLLDHSGLGTYCDRFVDRFVDIRAAVAPRVESLEGGTQIPFSLIRRMEVVLFVILSGHLVRASWVVKWHEICVNFCTAN